MDKQGKKDASITIKINGDKKNYKEDLLVHNWKLGEEESAAAEESAEEDSFDWVLPDEDPVPKEFKKINYVQKKKGKRKNRQLTPGITRLIYTLVGAVAVSLIFGFIILNVITDGEQSVPAIQLQEKENTEGSNASAAKTAITLESLNASVLQGGVFTTMESANAMKATFEGKGIPVIMIEMDANQFLFVGTAGDIEGAKAMGTKLTAENVEVYAKDIVLPEKQFQGTKADADFISKSKVVFSAIVAESAGAYTNGKINEEKMAEITVLLKELTGMKADDEKVKGLKDNLEAAVLNLQEYKSSSELQKLTSAQQSLLSYLEAYHNL